jgi:hypothetical protein
MKSVDSIPGWFDFQDLYREQVEWGESGDVFVEVGTCFGRSAGFMGDLIRASKKKIRFITVDPFEEGLLEEGIRNHLAYDLSLRGEDLSFEEVARKNIRECGLNGFVEIVKGRGVDVAESFSPGSLSFVFIDGSHEEADVWWDLEHFVPKVKPGGVIAGHDYDRDGVWISVDGFFGKEKVKVVCGRTWKVTL